MSIADERVRLAMHAYYNDPVLHARVQVAVQTMWSVKYEETHERMSNEEDAIARTAAALVLYMQGPDRMYERVGTVMRLTGEEHATSSRDYGRGFAAALDVVREHLSGLHDDPVLLSPLESAMLPLSVPKRLIDLCLDPDCGCNGPVHS